MALLSDGLSVWEISFRWGGHDPDKVWLRLPLTVRDSFRILISEIHHGHLECASLGMEKYHGDDPEEAKFYIRYWLDAVEKCSWGVQYDRKLLKWAVIDRMAFHTWCERHTVPLPEFWFPPGWGVEYEWPDDTPELDKERQAGETTQESNIRLDKRHRIEMACKQIALSIWQKDPEMTIKETAYRDEVQILAGGNEYELETVQGWLGEVDPRDPAKKRGRKRKNNSGSGNSDQS